MTNIHIKIHANVCAKAWREYLPASKRGEKLKAIMLAKFKELKL